MVFKMAKYFGCVNPILQKKMKKFSLGSHITGFLGFSKQGR